MTYESSADNERTDLRTLSLDNISAVLESLKGIPAELKSVHKTLKKLQSQSESLIRGQTESKDLLQRFEAGAVQVATNVGMPSAGSVGQRLATPGAHNFAGGRPGGAQLMRQASRGQLDSNPPPSLAPPSDQGIIRRTSVAIGMGGNVPFFGRPPAAAPPPQMVPQVVQMQVPAMQPLQPIQPMMAPMGVMPTAPTGGTRRASLAMGAVQGAAAAPAQQIQQMQAVLPAFQEADEDDEGFSDSSDEDEEEQKPENQKSPILNGVVKAGSETTPDAQVVPKPPAIKNVQLKIEEKDEDELSFSPSSKSDEETSFSQQRWTLKGAQPNESAEASRLSSMRSRAWQDDIGNQLREPKSRYLLMPDSLFSFSWYCLMTLCTLMLAGVLPIQLTYYWGDILPGWEPIWILVDICLIIEVPLGFLTTQLDPKTMQFMELHQVMVSYARSWLAIDVLAMWPLGITAEPMSAGYIIHRCLKLLKLLKLRYWFPRIEDKIQNRKLSWLKMSGAMLLLVHGLGCVWFIVRQQDLDSHGAVGSGEDYVADVYFVVMALTSVGFGDIVPLGTGARLYCVMVMLASSLFSGVLVAFVAQALRTVFDNEVERYVWQASEFMRMRKVPFDLQKRVEHGLRQKFQQELSFSVAPKILSNLSPSSQRELALELLRSAVMSFPVFEEAPEGFVGQIASAFTWVQSLAGDLVVEEGQLEEELVFVIEGSLMKIRESYGIMESDSDEEESVDGVKKTYLCKGAWFGERCLFQDDSLRDFTVITDVDSELAVLSAVDYMRILKLYPRLHRQHEDLVTAIEKGKIDLADLAYKALKQREDGVRGWTRMLEECFWRTARKSEHRRSQIR
ncbi:Potassium voltage-gated channel subfamily H member 1 (Ether-a-go-go potassium channel 1) (EAG channel 1) (EAG1) (r-eag) (Voltage-gated potassium channel subunit Kv10.1) [Durusdinium trenchii]|uniref:Potassium voltage-gated channel subfamily H member 1 (Ether-a-go-go potassium channel 1) (EAG channel 1) (EAG1) (R-eag) (Voltage-gated potassium channel subunit Kv10.1) n=1 Tax=Durusdinium trenchii TaxID=1381693 RepID=A0ABP0QX30_9DINO